MEPPGFHIQTDFFEGPLDLLLYLIRKNKLSIMQIRLSEITSEYLDYLKKTRGINPSREGEFIITAATLIYIKARTLLPRLNENEEDSPERQLVQTLIEYQKIQMISQKLREMEEGELMLWRRDAGINEFSDKEFAIEEVSAFQLAEIFFAIVRKKEEEDFLTIASKNYSVEDKKNEILRLLEENGYLNFSEYLQQLETLEDIVVSFFTLLEMVKRHLLIAVQKQLFGAITLWKKEIELQLERSI